MTMTTTQECQRRTTPTRLRILSNWQEPARALFSLVLNELGDFPTMRRMLLGIKERAEALVEA
jgi:hypothetical protein